MDMMNKSSLNSLRMGVYHSTDKDC